MCCWWGASSSAGDRRVPDTGISGSTNWPVKDFAGQGTRVIDLPAGTHEIETFEPYTLRYLHAKVRNSPDDCEFESPAMPDSEK